VTRRLSPMISLALASLLLILGSTITQAAPTATLTTDRGCGGSATYQNGETIRVRYSVSEDATVTITLTRPDGFVLRPVFQQFVPTGVTREYTGIVGGVSGPRQLYLDATSFSGSTAVECIYYGQGGPPFPPVPPNPPPSGPLTAELTTNKGCGPTALFVQGEPTAFNYRVSKDALVTLRLQRPDGTMSTLLFNQAVPGGIVRTLNGVIGQPNGQRLLILDAVAGAETTHAECAYTAQGTPGPATLTLSVDRGCGSTYRIGEQVRFFYQSSVTTQVTLTLRFPDGVVRLLVQNQPVLAGVTYSVLGVAGTPLGTRTATLTAATTPPPTDATCTYVVTQ
jgi:hypothetical protein